MLDEPSSNDESEVAEDFPVAPRSLSGVADDLIVVRFGRVDVSDEDDLSTVVNISLLELDKRWVVVVLLADTEGRRTDSCVVTTVSSSTLVAAAGLLLPVASINGFLLSVPDNFLVAVDVAVRDSDVVVEKLVPGRVDIIGAGDGLLF